MCQAQVNVTVGQSFDLEALFSELTKFCSRGLKRRGCISPQECAAEIFVDYVLGTLVRNGRCKISGNEIEIRFPGARDQKKVLQSYLWCEVKNKKSRCRNCRFSTNSSLGDELPDDDRARRRNSPLCRVDPSSPAEIYEGKELWEFVASQIESPELLAALIEHFKYGETTAEIARRSGVTPATLRQRFSRALAKLKNVLKSTHGYDQPAADVTSRSANISPDKSEVQKSRHGRSVMKQWRKA